MTPSFNAAPAARLIATTTRAKTRIAELPADSRPRTLDEGYDIQDALIAELADPVKGWKLGQGSLSGLRAAKLERALVGRVLASRCHPAGSTIRMAVAAPVTVEIEIAFALAHDIAPDAPVKPARDVVGPACLAAELILSRFVDRKAVGLPSYLAENVGFEALVIGPPIDAADIPRMMATATVDLDGARIVGHQTGDDMIDPYRAVDHLMAHARARGMTLRKGELVSTGTISKPFDCGPLPSGGMPAKRILARVDRASGPLEMPFQLTWP